MRDRRNEIHEHICRNGLEVKEDAVEDAAPEVRLVEALDEFRHVDQVNQGRKLD